MSLTDREKEQLKAMIDAGQPLPPRYKALLFAQPHEAELIWPGKTHEVTNVVLPFQSIEQIDEPRTGTERLRQWCEDASRHDAERSFHALFVRQEDWEVHRPANFTQLIAACG